MDALIAGISNTTLSDAPEYHPLATAEITSRVNKFCNTRSAVLSDIGYVDYNRHAQPQPVIPQPICTSYIDSLLLCCPCYMEDLKGATHPDIGFYKSRITESMSTTPLAGCYLSYLSCCRRDETHQMPEEYYADYAQHRPAGTSTQRATKSLITFKLSTSAMSLDHVVSALSLPAVRAAMRRDLVLPSAIDVTVDYMGNMLHREAFEVVLDNMGVRYRGDRSSDKDSNVDDDGDYDNPDVHAYVVDDVRKVGRNCISWIEQRMWQCNDTRQILVRSRMKFYNKFVQMLESPSVRKDIGSLIHQLVANEEESMQHKIMQCKDAGMTRVECTLYINAHIYNECYYSNMFYLATVDVMRSWVEILANQCLFRVCSYEQQWRALAEQLVSSTQVYLPDENVWSYCYWWNSITRKKHGDVRSRIDGTQVPLLQSVYNLPNLPLYYIECRSDNTGTLVDTKRDALCRVVPRDEGIIQHITRQPEGAKLSFVPGPFKSVYPSYAAIRKRPYAVPFADVGLVKHNNIELGWPTNTRYRAGSSPLHTMHTLVVSDSDWSELMLRRPHQPITAKYITDAVRDTRGRVASEVQGHLVTTEARASETENMYHRLYNVRTSVDDLMRYVHDAKGRVRRLDEQCLSVPLHMHGFYQSRNAWYCIFHDPRVSGADSYLSVHVDHEENALDLLLHLRTVVPIHNDAHVHIHPEPLAFMTPIHFGYRRSGDKIPEYLVERNLSDEQIQQHIADAQRLASVANTQMPLMMLLDTIPSAKFMSPASTLQPHTEYTVIAIRQETRRNAQCYCAVLRDVQGVDNFVYAGITHDLYSVLHDQVSRGGLHQFVVLTGRLGHNKSRNKDLVVMRHR